MKKLTVYLGDNSVILEGDNLKILIGGADLHPLLIVKDGDDTIAEFQNWDYWKKAKE